MAPKLSPFLYATQTDSLHFCGSRNRACWIQSVSNKQFERCVSCSERNMQLFVFLVHAWHHKIKMRRQAGSRRTPVHRGDSEWRQTATAALYKTMTKQMSQNILHPSLLANRRVSDYPPPPQRHYICCCKAHAHRPCLSYAVQSFADDHEMCKKLEIGYIHQPALSSWIV